ncbi:hypothetical protein OEZ86_014366 [Tetradesmus obliquus]|nr:hypothetical protein OEZ86_014366 [Tetradesmus obliquus]
MAGCRSWSSNIVVEEKDELMEKKRCCGPENQVQERSIYADFKRLATSYSSAQAGTSGGAACSWPLSAIAVVGQEL